MSMHTQLLRGLLALPVAALLIVAGALSPATSADPIDPQRATVDVAPALPRTVDFRSTLPGAMHIVKRVKVGEG